MRGRLLCAGSTLQWVRNGLTLTTADDYNSKVLSERGGAGQRVGYTKTSPRASPNRITQNHTHSQPFNQLEPLALSHSPPNALWAAEELGAAAGGWRGWRG